MFLWRITITANVCHMLFLHFAILHFCICIFAFLHFTDLMLIDHMIPYVLVGVPVETGLFEDEPVLPPFLGEVSFGVLLLPQPALAVTVAQVLTGNSPSTGTSEGTCRESKARM